MEFFLSLDISFFTRWYISNQNLDSSSEDSKPSYYNIADMLESSNSLELNCIIRFSLLIGLGMSDLDLVGVGVVFLPCIA